MTPPEFTPEEARRHELLMDWMAGMFGNVLDWEISHYRPGEELGWWTYEKIGRELRIMLNYALWRRDTWCYKFISEMEGPSLLTCPVRMLARRCTKDGIFPEWRRAVLRYHEQVGPPVQDEAANKELLAALMKKYGT